MATQFQVTPDGIEFVMDEQLQRKALLYNLLENEKASKQGAIICVPHPEIAALSDVDASILNLPQTLPLQLDIRCDGAIRDAGFKFTIRWIKKDKLPLKEELKRTGSISQIGQRQFRIAEPFYSVCEQLATFNANPPTDGDERMLRWGKIRGLLGEGNEEVISNDHFLHDLRIYYAQRFTLQLNPQGEDISFTPVLLGVDTPNDDPFFNTDTQKEPVLPSTLGEKFSQRFATFNDVRTSYPLENGEYVVIDPLCQKALAVAHKVLKTGTPKERTAFCRNPHRYLKESLGDEIADETLEKLFVETESFSNRVTGIGLWQKKVIPWVQRPSEVWLPPERLGVQIGNERIEIKKDELPRIEKEIQAALESGGGTVQINGKDTPATSELLQAVQDIKQQADPNTHQAKPTDLNHNADRKALLVLDNLENIDYQTIIRTPRKATSSSPTLLKAILLPHQKEGLKWLQSHWISGSPGALLADDMGLGKTLQVLAFLAWIKEERPSPKKPLLIVAPIGLLENWQAEHKKHLSTPGLGELLPLYGPRLRTLTTSSQNEQESGQSTLNRDAIQRADWVLTSYETLRNYQVSFALLPFSVVVFDEAQKIKTPGTGVTEAAKALNSEFTIAMTGTPVENRLADLWCIADTIQPGTVLGDLKSFSKQYEDNVDEAKLKALKNKMELGTEKTPALMLRRMKENHLPGLPKKLIHPLEETRVEMPPRQAEAYKDILERERGVSGKDIVKAIQKIRSVSLHPFRRQGSTSLSDDDYIQASARLIATVKILDDVHQKGEKALLFLESLDMQDARELPLILAHRYQLETIPVINGTVNVQERQKRVQEFEGKQGFDVMILSPKAGGVGLTLTAANHVIHLSRWWNPAVEDQCTDRVYRIGQQRTVHVYYPMAIHPTHKEDCFDMNLHRLIDKKRALSRDLLLPSTVSDADTRQLFDETYR